MKMLNRVVFAVFVSLCLMLKAQAAGETGLSGVVKNSSGPVQGAEIRIQGSDANKIGKVHTSANGHYNYPALEEGTYSVSLVIGGETKAAITNVATRSGQSQTLNFEVLKGSQVTPFAPGKHYVWIPSTTGTHLGHWAEVEGDGKGMSVGMSERLNNQGNAMVRHIQARSDGSFPH
jgi:VCBS repeat-containing protein